MTDDQKQVKEYITQQLEDFEFCWEEGGSVGMIYNNLKGNRVYFYIDPDGNGKAYSKEWGLISLDEGIRLVIP